MAQAGILRFENVAKSFGGTQALKGVSFDVNRGEVLALLGENGAGKSTLIKVLGGIVAADSGSVSIDGEPYRHRADARQSVAFVHQDLGLIEWMTVAENMALAQGFPRRGSRMPFAPIDWSSAERRAEEALALIGGRIDPSRRVRSLSRTEKSLVAIARALAASPALIIADEAVSSLDVLVQAHSASLAMTFYTGELYPREYRLDGFASEHGSWNRSRRTGYKVIRITLKDGKSSGEYEDFLVGFVTPDGNVWGRPVGVTVAKDGALLITDDGTGIVWRVAFTGSIQN